MSFTSGSVFPVTLTSACKSESFPFSVLKARSDSPSSECCVTNRTACFRTTRFLCRALRTSTSCLWAQNIASLNSSRTPLRKIAAASASSDFPLRCHPSKSTE
ncbi:hypothetical protein IscW_ISCW005850 [Ixodes scapularis]|uniref:Uncharacterized protein n=1 Tax=Ixodes scapularis TaxID=6945 RepID=B7PQ71_IXOSC|nr:hypothetical protein IscW_ISCW005850 [Ixodes scapularis]|eukprot:XP_002435912.1 hypothetical protein IscW_ISCW005850 [Ixodes scapularis]